MAETSLMSPLQTPAADFALPDLDGLAAQAVRAGFPFPYLIDESQDVTRVLAGDSAPEPHRPSIGCSIKWKQ